MKLTDKDKALMYDLIERGTAVGPVTQEMIDVAVKRYEWACKYCGHEIQEFGWVDFIGQARKELNNA